MSAVGVVIPAAGRGRRLGRGQNKVFETLAGKPILIRTLERLLSWGQAQQLVVVVQKEEHQRTSSLLRQWNIAGNVMVVHGGDTRQMSVYQGLKVLEPSIRWVFIHDGARPLITRSVLDRCLQTVQQHGAVGCGVRVKDTVKRVHSACIVETLDREQLWAIQTPQSFDYATIMAAYDEAFRSGAAATDDCALVEQQGHAVYMVDGDYRNIKITTEDDLLAAEAFLNEGSDGPMLVGMGYDVHRLVSGRPLILGGVSIDYSLGLAGHSDADVAVHALMDALLGAAGLGDIGTHFPDSDARFAGVSSVLLLEKTMGLLEGDSLRVVNADLTIAAERPRLAVHIPSMRQRLAPILRVAPRNLNIKATTTEGLGFVGAREGIAAYSVVGLARC